jgi:phage terminase small subunit
MSDVKGRKPKPPAVRALHKSDTRADRRDRRDQAAADALEARGTDARPVPAPIGLVPAERKYWAYFAPLLSGARVLTPADVESLADYCRACGAVDDRGRRLRTALAKRTLDQRLVRLLDSQLRGWVEKKTRLASELGLTAIARTRINWTGYPQRPGATADEPPQAPKSKLAELQEQAAAWRRPVGVQR